MQKWNINSAPNDRSVPRMYVQDVKNHVPNSNIPKSQSSFKESGALQKPAIVPKNVRPQVVYFAKRKDVNVVNLLKLYKSVEKTGNK